VARVSSSPTQPSLPPGAPAHALAALAPPTPRPAHTGSASPAWPRLPRPRPAVLLVHSRPSGQSLGPALIKSRLLPELSTNPRSASLLRRLDPVSRRRAGRGGGRDARLRLEGRAGRLPQSLRPGPGAIGGSMALLVLLLILTVQAGTCVAMSTAEPELSSGTVSRGGWERERAGGRGGSRPSREGPAVEPPPLPRGHARPRPQHPVPAL
jgi:hypothetical protein